MSNLGAPLPAAEHATSVSLPTINDVVGYEQGNVKVLDAMQSGYPRFFFALPVKKLIESMHAQYCSHDETCLPLPTLWAAQTCVSLAGELSERCRIIKKEDGHESIFIVIGPKKAESVFKSFWQHAGVIVSSRRALAVLSEHKEKKDLNVFTSLKKRIAQYAKCHPSDVLLFSSGMAAFTAALRIAKEVNKGKQSIQFGFPYLDSLKVQTLLGYDPVFFSNGTKNDLKALDHSLKDAFVLSCEVPSNPLLSTPPLKAMSALTQKHGVPLVVDDTIATWFNVETTPYADMTVTSLTKFFSGKGDVIGGALIVRESSEFYNKFKDAASQCVQECLWQEDAKVLLGNSTDMQERVRKINANADALAGYLSKHSLVDFLYHPSLCCVEAYDEIKKHDGGYGGVFSFILKGGEESFRRFYDALSLSKGPGLGTNFTLTCPYTYLAHFHEQQWAEAQGVSKYLIRVSVGIEPFAQILNAFASALEAAREAIKVETRTELERKKEIFSLRGSSAHSEWPFRALKRIPLDSCYLSPKNYATVHAIQEFALTEAELGSGIATHSKFNNECVQGKTRALLGRLLSVDPKDISLKENTNAGLTHVAFGYPFKDGDEVITYRYDYPSVKEPFRPLIKLRNIKMVELQGEFSVHGIPCGWSFEELEDKITERTRLVVISHVQFISGHTADLQKLSKLCRAKQIHLVVDLAQSVGVLPVEPERLGIDAVVFPCWKGLLASRGVAVLWSSANFRSLLEMNIRGSGALQMDSFTDLDPQECTDGRKFEPSTLPTNLLHGLNTSLRTNFFTHGVSAVAQKIVALQETLLSHVDWTLAEPLFPDKPTAGRGLIVSFALPGWKGREEQVVEKLAQQGIAATCRKGALRFAPHYFLNEDDIKYVADTLNGILANETIQKTYAFG